MTGRPPGQYTKQGYSLQFGTNVLGHQRLISLLLPLLQQTSVADPDSPARVVLLSSAGHASAPKGGVDYKTVMRPAGDDSDSDDGDKSLGRRAVAKPGGVFSKWVDYGQSKWGDIAMAEYINWHYGPGSGTKDGEIIATAVHPGESLYALQKGRQRLSQQVPWRPTSRRIFSMTR